MKKIYDIFKNGTKPKVQSILSKEVQEEPQETLKS